MTDANIFRHVILFRIFCLPFFESFNLSDKQKSKKNSHKKNERRNEWNAKRERERGGGRLLFKLIDAKTVKVATIAKEKKTNEKKIAWNSILVR